MFLKYRTIASRIYSAAPGNGLIIGECTRFVRTNTTIEEFHNNYVTGPRKTTLMAAIILFSKGQYVRVVLTTWIFMGGQTSQNARNSTSLLLAN